ncbi:hypothetical protein IV203_002363 [Nitzschia inconspicua]|uniref:Uncharacterized protein n=1 Tax=Nitzschia inconspicua TaxID=303405 RepID=A0A9K3LA07_9STRA|nr:hypothetical protein IV203_002363 [Nitzschia inconspicua]
MKYSQWTAVSLLLSSSSLLTGNALKFDDPAVSPIEMVVIGEQPRNGCWKNHLGPRRECCRCQDRCSDRFGIG